MKLAVLGCGSIGRRHLRNLLELGARDVIAYDPVETACRSVETELNIPARMSLDEIWAAKPNAVLITAPSNLHVPLALEAVCRGSDVFVEKPVAHSRVGLDELENEIRKNNLVSMVACNMRFHPGPRTVKSLLDQNKIGAVLSARIQGGSYLPRWRPQQDYKKSYSASTQFGGAILDCIHEIDLALWYLGPASLVASAKLSAKNLGLETDGLVEMLLRHDSGALSSMHLNFVQRDYRRCCQIIGENGTVYWDFSERAVKIFGEDGNLSETISEPAGWDLNQMYLDELNHFLTCVETRRQTGNPISGGIAALNIALAARNSHPLSAPSDGGERVG
jgi:predicted dehydrogenase